MPAASITSLKQQLKQKTEEIKLLHQITESISYDLNVDDVLNKIVNLVSTTMKADSCFIYLAEDTSLILKASKVPHPKMINRVAMNFGEGITGWVAQHKKNVVIKEHAYKDKRFKVVANLGEDQWEAFVSMPITYQDQVVGVINVQNRKQRDYSADQIRLLETIASQVGGALFNAKLISETRALKQALETRKVVEKAKGMLMKHYTMTEDQAYQMIRKKSMDTKKTMKEIADAIILTLI